jgi:hypothetical protein
MTLRPNLKFYSSMTTLVCWREYSIYCARRISMANGEFVPILYVQSDPESLPLTSKSRDWDAAREL